MKKYIPRYADENLKKALESMGAVLITGPNGVEKQLQQYSNLKVY